MPDVSTIVAELRARGGHLLDREPPPGYDDYVVLLADAVSAVEEAYRAGGDARTAEIMEVLRVKADAEYDDDAGDYYLPGYYHSAAQRIAARFPAGGEL